MSELLKSIFLGGIEGLTEFLPVSSTGHLIVFADMLNFNTPISSVFEVVIQSGAILAVCIAYFQKLYNAGRGFISGDPASRRFVAAILLAFLPAAVAGAFLHDFIKEVLFSPVVVAVALILGGVAIIAAERFYRPLPSVHAVEDLTPALSIKIGIAQCLAMIPGVSRSGATIIGALLLGVERKTAAEFSFFLAIPTMVGASTYDIWKNHVALTGDSLQTIIVGFISAFLVAWLVVRWFVAFVSTRGFTPFAWYRIAFGTFILAWMYSQGAIG